MPKRHSSNAVIKVLTRRGFFFVSQKGSHAKYHNTSKPVRTVIVPARRPEIPIGTFKSIVRQSGLKEEDFSAQI